MAICKHCSREMTISQSCTPAPVVIDGKDLGQVLHDAERGAICHDCNTPAGGYHHPGCDDERCPACGGQLISCGCEGGSSEDGDDEEYEVIEKNGVVVTDCDECGDDDDAGEVAAIALKILVARHPMPWTIDYDWMTEVYDANKQLVTKFQTKAEAEAFIAAANEAAAAPTKVEILPWEEVDQAAFPQVVTLDPNAFKAFVDALRPSEDPTDGLINFFKKPV